MTKTWWIGLLVLACAVACDDDDSGSGNATYRCETFVDVWCDKAMSCLQSVGTITESEYAANFDACVDVGVAAARCDRAISVTLDYDPCLAAIDRMACSFLDVPLSEIDQITLPDPCPGVIIVQ